MCGCVIDIHGTMWHCIYIIVEWRRVISPCWEVRGFDLIEIMLWLIVFFLNPFSKMPSRLSERRGRVGNRGGRGCGCGRVKPLEDEVRA